ncbi:putative zinc protease [Abditibacteriota bacterium]|nr:putative zinc protease [Abditibacteriota bacterium]
MHHHKHTLANGLTIVGEHNPEARSLAMGFFVQTGARDETSEVSGVSHFLEHMMFKGTDKRTPEDVNRQFDEMGARYNAFTSEEETVYYGAVLPEFQGRLLDLLADMMRPALRDTDFDMEKNVILEEIAMYQDKPTFRVFDLGRESYFGKHSLGNSVLGSAQSITDLKRDQMHEYFGRRYAANNMTLVLVGNYNWEEAIAQTEQLCGNWNTADSPREKATFEPEPRLVLSETDKFNRAHIALFAPGFAAQDINRLAAGIACEVIGSGEGSRLYWALVHDGLAEAAQIGHDANDGEGAFYGYILVDPNRAQEALDTFRSTLAKACADGLSIEEVERAKRRFASSMTLGAETPMGRLRPVGMDWMLRRQQRTPEHALGELLAVTPEQVNEVLRSRPFERATVVALGPLKELV